MLVQLSPWQTCSTSVPVSTKRRRKRSDASDSAQEERPLEFEASFVTSTKRNRHKKKLKHSGASIQEDPTVAITTSHRISIVGRTQSRDASSLLECSQWQFRSHPGRTTAFVQEQSSVNGSKGRTFPRIPAILDARNDKVYALQNENTTLSCWNADTASGPGDVDSPAVKASLSKPAISLSVLPFQRGVAYGTCQDGSLYVARWTADETLRVQYSEPVQTRDTQHVCTIVQAGSSSSGGAKVGQKRKVSQDGSFVFYQVFAKEAGVLIYRREVNLIEVDCLDESNAKVSFVDLVSSIERAAGLTVNLCSASASQVDDSTIAVVYAAERPENGKSKTATHQRYYCAPIGLETGGLMRAPFVLASYTRHAGAVTPFLLAVGTLDEILLYDIAHGTVVHRAFVTDVVGDCKNWSLITEARKGRLAILSVQNGHAHVSFAKATLDEMSYQQAEAEGNGYSLAVGLRSSLASSPVTEDVPLICSRRNLLDLTPSVGKGDSERRLDDCVTEALFRLRACIDDIQDPDNTDIQPFHFMNEYEKSVITVLSASPPPGTKQKKKKPVSPKSRTKKAPVPNGVHHHAEASDSTQDTEATSTASKHDEVNGSAQCLVNGLKVPDNVRGYTPSSLPQRFVDGATSIVLSVLQLPQVENKAVGIRSKLARLDARLILSRLVRTGKVSARRHFGSSPDQGHERSSDEDTSDWLFTALRSLKLTNKGNSRVFSPVDLMHDMITCCPDISEGQMITMIHFMLCKALPEDIAENFLDHGNLQPGHPYRVLAKRFGQVRSALRKQHATAKVGDDDVSQLKEQEESLSFKLVRAGTTILVGRLVQYSRCNETLLRNAMQEGLAGRHEPVILSRILVDLLNDRGKDAQFPAAKQNRFSPSTALISKWIFTLCEACRDRLGDSADATGEVDDESPLEYILRAVRADLKNTEAVMSLHEMVYQVDTSKTEVKESETVEADKFAASASHNREATPVPPYSIERLAF